MPPINAMALKLLTFVFVAIALSAPISAAPRAAQTAPPELSYLSAEDKELLLHLSSGWEEGWENYIREGGSGRQTRAVEDSVRYLIWTQDNPSNEFELEPFDDASVESSPLDMSKDTYIQAHGFGVDGKAEWVVNAKDEFLDKFDCNVISVDYGELAQAPFYLEAVMNVYKTADLTAAVLDWLVESHGLNLQRVYMAGHSLGAHMMGITGLRLQRGSVARVTGLDPAGPLFSAQNDTHRITPASGDFVDIIHSNSGSVTDGCLGLFSPLGDVDFYPNGGSHQPGCVRWNSTTADWLDMFGSCSHSRGPEYWVESIGAQGSSANSFYSWPCKDYGTFASGQCFSCQGGCLQMGFPAIDGDLDPSDDYFLDTDSKSPYALGN